MWLGCAYGQSFSKGCRDARLIGKLPAPKLAFSSHSARAYP
jgi:hypothetical protein